MPETKLMVQNSRILYERRQVVLTGIESLLEQVHRNSPTAPSVLAYLKEKCDGLRNKFDKIEDDIIAYNVTAAKPLATIPERNAFEQMADQVMFKICEVMPAPVTTPQHAAATYAQPAVPLRPLELPMFNGQNFNQFWEIFSSLVHDDPAINPTVKYHHLLHSLADSVKVIIADYTPINAQNYPLAVSALKNHYDNPRRIVAQYIQSMLNASALSHNHKPDELTQLTRIFRNNSTALSQMKLNDLAAALMFQMLYAKLDKRTRIAFEQSHPGKAVCNLNELLQFLQERVQTDDLQAIVTNVDEPIATKSRPTPARGSVRSLLTEKKDKEFRYICPLDQQKHPFIHCPKFQGMKPEQRLELLNEHNLCHRCFGKHARKDCKSQKSCRTCNGPHHGMVCREAPPATPVSNTPPPHKPAPATNASKPATDASASLPHCCQASTSCSHTLLATALVYVEDHQGYLLPMRCVIDSGSQVQVMSERAVQTLGLPRTKGNTFLQGIGGHSRTRGVVSAKVHSRCTSFSVNVDCLILPQVCGNLPATQINCDVPALQYADPEWNIPKDVDMLLGAGIFSQVVSVCSPPISVDAGLIAQPSELGYLLLGEVKFGGATPTSLLSIDDSLHAIVDRFWKIEEGANPKSSVTNEELQAEEFYTSSTTRQSDGRYVVRLPFRANAKPLIRNRRDARAYAMQVERRLQKNPEALQLYNGYFSDLQADGLMSKATNKESYLLLHHAVFKDSTTTRVRPVFDASSPDQNGNSLNSQLLPGPALQSDLAQVILRFRFQPIPLVADIKRMYNSVMLHPEDRRHQHILWRPSPESELEEWELNSVTFGVSSSAFLAQRTVKQLVLDEGHDYPIAAAVLLERTYVDDVVACFPDVATAVTARDQLIQLTSKGGFELKKFASNVEAVLQGVPTSHQEIGFGDHSLSILGTAWKPDTDTFHFSIPQTVMEQTKCTKRIVLSAVARIFDCQGLLAPLTLLLKIFMKSLHQGKLDWDTHLPHEQEKSWHELIQHLPLLCELKIPRVVPVFTCKRLELVGFSDGSSVGYGAAIYLRCVYETHATLHLIKAKSKAAPVKPTLTIPRMELQASLLLVEIFTYLEPVLVELPIAEKHFFTDSSVVLCWLRTPVQRLQVFVANRVDKILSTTTVQEWHHVDSKSNCADPASRGLPVPALISSQLWWQGPQFLQCQPIEWPPSPPLPAVIPECRPQKALLVVPPVERESIFQRFSSFMHMLRVTCWMRRFISARLKQPYPSGPITSVEIANAKRVIIQKVQAEYFSNHDPKNFPKSWEPLNPFKCPDGYIRVGGRLENSPLPYNAKHPILLPKESHVSMLLCREAHERTLHGGTQLMRSKLQENYWIIGVTRLLKKVKRECKRCHILSAANKSIEPKMADLPNIRFKSGRPFYNTSMDFCGPFNVHEGPRPRARTLKVYVCVFTCLATRAAHLEVVEDLSTAAFISALDRMIARRGLMKVLLCDNGTNFKGASAELKNLLSNEELQNQVAKLQIEFQFISPLSPWKNGVTERMVGLFKSHLIRVVGQTVLTFTEFTTLVTRIEAVLNSRPIIPLSTDPEDGILTPAHFLIGSNLLSYPDADLSVIRPNTLSRWQVVKAAFQSFWKQWHHQYLHTLIGRAKWHKDVPNLTVDQVVILKKEGSRPLMWPLGIIQAVHPHKDGTVRVVTVKTAHGIYQRPAQMVIPLLS